MDSNRLADAIAGGLLGHAVGDALGATVEFMSPDAIKRRYGKHTEIVGGGAFGWRPGQGTDDSDMSWAVLSSYIDDDGDFNLKTVGRKFVEWADTNPPDIGGTTFRTLAKLKQTDDPQTSGETDFYSCGNGSLMRALPTGLIRQDREIRDTETATISAITHAHDDCIDSCIAYNSVAVALLEGLTPLGAIDRTAAMELSPKVIKTLSIDPDTPVDQLKTSGYVIHSLGCAIWAIQQDRSLEPVLIDLVNRGDDADTTGCIAGGLLGVKHGVSAIPERWLNIIEYRQKLQDAATQILKLRSR